MFGLPQTLHIYSINNNAHSDDLHWDRSAQALTKPRVHLFYWYQDGQAEQWDHQLGHISVRQVLDHWTQSLWIYRKLAETP